jgi:hypothetical protein
MAQQLTLFKQLPGWDDMNLIETVNESIGERLSNELELMYFGVSQQRVRQLGSADLCCNSVAICT